MSHHFPFKPAFLFCSSLRLDGPSGRYYSFSDHIVVPPKSSQNNHKSADFHWISISPLPQPQSWKYEMVEGGSDFLSHFSPFSPPYSFLPSPTPNCTSLQVAEGCSLLGRVEIWFSWCQSGTCSKCQFIFLGVFWGFLGDLHCVDLSLAIVLAQTTPPLAVCLWAYLSPCFPVVSLHTPPGRPYRYSPS